MERQNYKIVNINTASPDKPMSAVLIIYTGGTLGMSYDERGSLMPFNFSRIVEKVPSIQGFNIHITVISFPELVDSANIRPVHWVDMAYIIYENYRRYDGFVVIHGTDTMAYSASALSYMLEGLNKPVIFTGAQLPIGSKRSDAHENFITALEIASEYRDGKPVVPEVCIYFGNLLLRGNRSSKRQSIHFDAFESENYPILGEAGVVIDYNKSAIKPYKADQKLVYHSKLDSNVAILKLFPGISRRVVESILQIPDIKGVVLETFGSGNAPTDTFMLDSLSDAIDRGVIILNISQCSGGRVIQGRYQTSRSLDDIGVISGKDMTTEAAVTKMMFLLGKEQNPQEVRRLLPQPICGETY
ncbi:asparaginase [Catalinimonas sp. 4WD22]|uniref:asparaginase n=1 Tax=Catalinimonas locisalis TaxID=3133978 RepID=UPI0031016BF3